MAQGWQKLAADGAGMELIRMAGVNGWKFGGVSAGRSLHQAIRAGAGFLTAQDPHSLVWWLTASGTDTTPSVLARRLESSQALTASADLGTVA